VNADNSINQSAVKTYALLYSGEETSIGGLYTTDDETTRQGVPFLKDLPPWVLGLRYLFGSEQITKTKDELIILLKVELTPTVRTRAIRGVPEDVIDKKRKEYDQEYEKH
jgi:type IV pilus assembly protein PilQ